VVSKMYETVNPVVSQVFSHVFADSSFEIVEKSQNLELKKYFNEYMLHLGEFPIYGINEVLFSADDLYDSLVFTFRSGVYKKYMPRLLLVCATLYSIVQGTHSEDRERICKHTAARLRKFHRNAVNALKERKETTERENIRIEAKRKTKAKFDKMNIANSNNPQEIREFLVFNGISIPSSVPQPKIVKSIIQRQMDIAMMHLNKGDKSNALKILQKSLTIWNKGEL